MCFANDQVSSQQLSMYRTRGGDTQNNVGDACYMLSRQQTRRCMHVYFEDQSHHAKEFCLIEGHEGENQAL